MTVSYKGTTDVRETSRTRDLRGVQIVYNVVKEGLYDDLLDDEPGVGTVWSEDEDYAVETVHTEKARAGLGKTTIVYVYDSGLETVNRIKDIKIEIVWQRNDADLRMHPKIISDSQTMSLECQNLIEDYLAARTSAKRATIKTLIDAFGETAKKYLELRVKGIDSILRFLPIVRKTSTQLVRPTQVGADLGKKQDPEIGNVGRPLQITIGNPLDTATPTTSTLQYVKFRDDVTRTGRNKKWERVEEWHGFPQEEMVDGMFLGDAEEEPET